MTRLLAAEMRRALSRRLVLALTVLGVAGVLIGSIVTFARSSDSPGAAADLERRRAGFQACMSAPGQPDEDRFQRCEAEFGMPFVERDRTFRYEGLPSIMLGTVVPLAIAGWLVAASLIGAEWRAGTVGTTLTWEPDRVKLFVAKAVAALVTVAGMTLLIQAVLALALLPAGMWRGTMDGFSMSETTAMLARTVAFCAITAAIGFSIGSLGRNTAAALGVGFLYFVTVEGLLLPLVFRRLQDWLFVSNAAAFLAPGETGGPSVRSATAAGTLLAIYAGVALLSAGATFRNRDVT